ncbi:MAG TPA: ATP-grasp domain-containing protein [Candidatus Krumholzibacteria bacterium]|nr:ATP-grasp domain-containing protein [Candidatus Krumholzibacteria bacterium]
MRPRLLLLVSTSTYRADAFVRAAKRLPVDLSIASENPSSLSHLDPVSLPAFDFSNPVEAAYHARIFAAAHPVDAVIGVDDASTLAAATIAEALDLPHNAPDAVRAALNKYLGRERMRAAGVPVPDYRLVPISAPESALPGLAFPAVVKPLAMAASRGVVRVDDATAFIGACRRIGPMAADESPAHDSLARGHLLVESYVPGWEVAVEGLVTDGLLHVLAIFDKPDPLEGPFFPETMYVTPSRHAAATQESIVSMTQRAVAALGLRHGPVHVELRGNDGGIVPIEVHARSIGGLCSRVLRFDDGRSLEDVILQHALGLLGVVPPRPDRPSGVWMMQSPRRGRFVEMRGVTAACEVPGVDEVVVTARPRQVLAPLPEGFLYLGFIFARGDSAAAVEATLRTAFDRLQPVVSDLNEAAPA